MGVGVHACLLLCLRVCMCVFCGGLGWCVRACVCVCIFMSVVSINILLKQKLSFYLTLVEVAVKLMFEYCLYFSVLYVCSCVVVNIAINV